MKIRHIERGMWQAITDHVEAPSGVHYYNVCTSGSLPYVLWWHPKFIRMMKQG